MNFIIVIRGVTHYEYMAIRQDITQQIEARTEEHPLFVRLSECDAEIEIIWIDGEMEKANFVEVLKQNL